MIDLSAQPALFFQGDIDDATLAAIRQAGAVAWDIETTGLDWETEQIATVQLSWGHGGFALVKAELWTPGNLRALLEDRTLAKTFHHAMFDLRFMAHSWQVTPANISCTKIASKILAKGRQKDHSLAALVAEDFGVVLEKSSRLTDWTASVLSEEQIAYALNDVRYLLPLMEKLRCRLQETALESLCFRCFDHIPTRVALDVGRFGDVYEY